MWIGASNRTPEICEAHPFYFYAITNVRGLIDHMSKYAPGKVRTRIDRIICQPVSRAIPFQEACNIGEIWSYFSIGNAIKRQELQIVAQIKSILRFVNQDCVSWFGK